VFHEHGGGGWRTALGAALAWGLLLVLDAVAGPIGALSHTLAGVMRIPGLVLVLLTLTFPAVLAWSAATVAAQSRRLVARSQDRAPERYAERPSSVSATSR
jgi:hypothetical protein